MGTPDINTFWKLKTNDSTNSHTSSEERTDNRYYFVPRDGRIVKRRWQQLSDTERAAQIEKE
jgi:hypothetical protein